MKNTIQENSCDDKKRLVGFISSEKIDHINFTLKIACVVQKEYITSRQLKKELRKPR